MATLKKVSIVLLACILALMPSCSDDFLDQNPKTALSVEQVFASLDNVQPFLNGLYFSWRSTRVNRKGFFLMLGTDESQQGEYQVRTDADQAGFDKYDGFLSVDNKPVAELWNIRWPVVVQATEAIQVLTQKLDTATEEESVQIAFYIAQAQFYRAAVLFELASYWGGLPIPEVKGRDIILGERKSAADVYRQIESDFLAAAELLPNRALADKRIPTRWAARALLGKLYMAVPPETGMRDFVKAKEQFELVVSQGGYSLTPSFANLWDPLKSPGNEPIYSFLFNNIWPDTNEAQWYAGSRAASSNPTNYIGGYDLILPTAYSRTDKSMNGLWEEGDQRKLQSIRYDFINGNNIPSVYAGFGEDQLMPHIKKYEDIRTDGVETFYNSGKDMYYIRYADILLCLAECLNETGNTAGAVAIVNDQIRKRAWGGTLPTDKRWSNGMSQQDFRREIMDERIRELCFEGWRRFDLIRTDQFVPLISQRNRWAQESGMISNHHKLLPIPLVEILQNPSISHQDQNPGY